MSFGAVLPGCTPPASSSAAFVPGRDASYAAAPCPDPNFPGVRELNLSPQFSCGFLTVPENRAAQRGRTIRIAVAKAKAASPNPKPDPIVYLTGGPGGTAIVSAEIKVQKGLNRDRDVYFIDQRAEYHSDPRLTCPEIDKFSAEATALSVMAASTAEKDLAATKACRERLAAGGYNLSSFDTAENAADIADLRAVLGIKQWIVYGVSYGSDLALQLLRDHPQGIRSVVLDSLAPPQVNLMDQFWPSAAEGYKALFSACTGQPACDAAYPNLAAEFTATVNRLAQQPLSVQLPPAGGQPAPTVVIDGYTLANLLVVLTLSPGSYAGLPKMIHEIAAGNGRSAAEALLGTLSPPGVTAYGLAYGVLCREHVAFTSQSAAVTKASRALPDFPRSVLSLEPQAARISRSAGCGTCTARSPRCIRKPAARYPPCSWRAPSTL